MPYIVNIRNRRQITLPLYMLKQLSLSVGDKLSLQVKKKKLIAKPIKNQVINTLAAIQKTFRKNKISKYQLQKNGLVLRKKLVKEVYGQ